MRHGGGVVCACVNQKREFNLIANEFHLKQNFKQNLDVAPPVNVKRTGMLREAKRVLIAS